MILSFALLAQIIRLHAPKYSRAAFWHAVDNAVPLTLAPRHSYFEYRHLSSRVTMKLHFKIAWQAGVIYFIRGRASLEDIGIASRQNDSIEFRLKYHLISFLSSLNIERPSQQLVWWPRVITEGDQSTKITSWYINFRLIQKWEMIFRQLGT